ncbi:alanine dehydrogenase [Tissierella sp. Yu-01]|uniref:alanine dehydrogenase n=1 Tax=Tissierella sp. Yu-01 TaxID=3035694 RepID=UPI00240E5F0A|nr:alanine dehydrogenase [Tissierella sp. Yu-01]WFA07791.1 alanine dehydrogenase [Tissierella sp. Yu-01]
MIIGVPKEIQNNENRVGMTPAGVYTLAQRGHKVMIQTNAGVGSGFPDEEYINVGAIIIKTPDEVYKSADMIVKVKEPHNHEVDMMKEGQILLTYLHLAAEPELTKKLMDKKIIGIAYETVQLEDGSLPLLTPMSEVAGRIAVIVGGNFLSKAQGGKGVLISGVPGVKPAKVTILGAGTVGINAAKIAVGLGADVTILNKSPGKLKYIEDIYGSRIKTLILNELTLADAVKDADLFIGGILIPGGRAPKLVKEYMVKSMKPGSVIVDVAIDQGGCVETITHATTHEDPTYEKYGVIHYSVPNIPGAYAKTSTYALTNVTLPYVVRLADDGLKESLKNDESLRKGVNVMNGKCTCESLAKSLNMEYTDLSSLI